MVGVEEKLDTEVMYDKKKAKKPHQMPLGEDHRAHFLQGPYSRLLLLTPKPRC